MTDSFPDAVGPGTDAIRTVGKTAADPGREAMRRVGRRALGLAVDEAVSRVERVANRLDRVGTGPTGLGGGVAGRLAAGTGSAVRARVGAGFSLVMRTAVQVLRFLQRLAVQLLEALRSLASRFRPAPSEAEAAGSDERRVESAAAEDEPSRPDRAKIGRGDRRAGDGSGQDQGRPARVGPAPGPGGSQPSGGRRTAGQRRPSESQSSGGRRTPGQRRPNRVGQNE